ncbi:Hypothetical protein NTJ_01888 [Nesidiocoris tenuis]|uniref:Uncharacterized protein n=1 Tax=Nesidiocoris tenuis TaxID=355587 RepID=A0ABN7A9U6_9HEMI|nr:Hypothetical protein NTJ_01888 [Nesidiocoris tenuis]
MKSSLSVPSRPWRLAPCNGEVMRGNGPINGQRSSSLAPSLAQSKWEKLETPWRPVDAYLDAECGESHSHSRPALADPRL